MNVNEVLYNLWPRLFPEGRGTIRSDSENCFLRFSPQANVSDTASVFVVGAGAVEGSWAPLERHFSIRDTESLVSLMAIPVYGARGIDKCFYETTRTANTMNGVSEPYIEMLKRLRAEISEALAGFDGFSVRDFSKIPSLAKLSGPARILTTNWDVTLSTAFPNSDIIHIHGVVNHPDSLVLPTEVSTDRHRILEGDSGHEAFLALHWAHIRAIRWLRDAQEIVLWGVGLNGYDAELNSIVVSAGDRAAFTVVNTRVEVAKLVKWVKKKSNVVWVDPGTGKVSKID